MMDVVIVDVPPSYGMLLSRHQGTSAGGSIQFDLSYAPILVFGRETRRLYREPKVTYVISDLEIPTNFPSYTTDNLGNFLLSHEPVSVNQTEALMCGERKIDPMGLWILHIDGACNKEGNGVGVLPRSPKGQDFPHGFKLEFDCTNNVVEYEAFIPGLETNGKLRIKELQSLGDLHLVVNRAREKSQTKHPWFR